MGRSESVVSVPVEGTNMGSAPNKVFAFNNHPPSAGTASSVNSLTSPLPLPPPVGGTYGGATAVSVNVLIVYVYVPLPPSATTG